MRSISLALISAAVCAGFAFSQTSAQPEQDRAFKFAHAQMPQQMNEIATTIRSIGDIAQISFDASQSQIFYVPYAQALQELQEVITCVRSAGSLHRLLTYSATRAVVTRATAEQTAFAEWLFDQFSKPANELASALYHIESDSDDTVQVFHLSRPKSSQDFQEVATLIQSIGDIRYLFTYNATKAFVARGNSDQLRLAEWLVNELDEPTRRQLQLNILWQKVDGNVNSSEDTHSARIHVQLATSPTSTRNNDANRASRATPHR